MNTLKSHASLLILFCVFFGSSCIKYQRIPTTAELGNYRVSVRPYCDSALTNSQRHYEKDGTTRVIDYEFTCGDTKVSIRGNMLTVNGKSYGTLNEHDHIAVDYGKVRVNSAVREELR